MKAELQCQTVGAAFSCCCRRCCRSEWLCFDGGHWHGTALGGLRECGNRSFLHTTTPLCLRTGLQAHYADRFGEKHVKFGGAMV